MLDTLTHANATDFKSRYQGTFGWFVDPDTAKKTLVQVAQVSTKSVLFKDSFGRDLMAHADAGVMFEFIPVNRQWVIKDDHSLFYTSRVPARMWKRGIAAENTNVKAFTSDGSRLAEVPLTRELLFAILAPNKTSLSTGSYSAVAVAGLNSKGCLLSKHFVISPKSAVYFFDKQIGTYKDRVITLSDDTVRQELLDLIARNNLDLQIKVH